jgi:hypothetical protein
MNTIEILKRYHKEVDPHILASYQEAPKSVFVNTDDKDLIPIEIELPDMPEAHLIDGFGLPARDQMWCPPKMPKRLKDLEIKFETIDEIWEELESKKDIYSEEIDFIRTQWDRRLNGYWFFNNGVPTYIDGWNYFYCAWWHIDVGLPGYRDRDRRFFLFARKIYLEKKSPRCNEDGITIFDKKGRPEWIERGRRVFYGFNYPKHRREGATFKAECINYEIISRTINAFGGIQSMTDTQSKKCYLRHLIAPWKKLPFFFKPNYEGSTAPKTGLWFTPPATRIASRGSLVTSESGLESGIDYEVADPSAYDSTKLYFHHDDEVGKLKRGLSCWRRHEIVKECLSDGATIIGYTIKTSTVGEMEKGGGREFKRQCELSNYYERNENGQTRSGLATLFIPAYDGLKGFIDKYGMSVIDHPTKEQAEFIGDNIGAKEYLLNERRGLALEGDQDKLSEKIRLYPIRYAECFRTSQKSSGFNMNKLESYIDDLAFAKKNIVVGNFKWKDNIADSKVLFEANPNGRFKVSHQLNPDEANRKYYSNEEESWIPGNTHWGIAGGDPFKFNKTEGNRKSKGAGAVVRKGKIRDGDFTMKRKFVCTYSNRTYDKEEYGEDMLKMCVYYGVKMFPEIDVPFLWDYFDRRGYGSFLLYKIDPKTFEVNKTPGATSNKIKQDIFTEYMEWIEKEAKEETHIEILEEARDIDGVEDMTNYDLFTAAGYALLGTHGIYDEIAELEEKEYTLDNYLKKRTYSYSKVL